MNEPDRYFLQVYDSETGTVMREFEITGRSTTHVEKIEAGLLRNLNPKFNIKTVKNMQRWASTPDKK